MRLPWPSPRLTPDEVIALALAETLADEALRHLALVHGVNAHIAATLLDRRGQSAAATLMAASAGLHRPRPSTPRAIDTHHDQA
jgi:hypothetical protein